MVLPSDESVGASTSPVGPATFCGISKGNSWFFRAARKIAGGLVAGSFPMRVKNNSRPLVEMAGAYSSASVFTFLRIGAPGVALELLAVKDCNHDVCRLRVRAILRELPIDKKQRLAVRADLGVEVHDARLLARDSRDEFHSAHGSVPEATPVKGRKGLAVAPGDTK